MNRKKGVRIRKMREALLILDGDEREQEPFSFGKKCPGLWLHLSPVFNGEGIIRLRKIWEL